MVQIQNGHKRFLLSLQIDVFPRFDDPDRARAAWECGGGSGSFAPCWILQQGETLAVETAVKCIVVHPICGADLKDEAEIRGPAAADPVPDRTRVKHHGSAVRFPWAWKERHHWRSNPHGDRPEEYRIPDPFPGKYGAVPPAGTERGCADARGFSSST